MPNSLHDPAYRKAVAMLVETRKAKGLTQARVAERLRRPQSHIAKIEGCERRIDFVEFIALARALEEEPEILFGKLAAIAEGA